MPQNVDAPIDNGRITLPKTDAAMTRVAPTSLKGDKGSKSDIKLGATDDAFDQKLLTRIQKRMERAISAESENRKAALEDLRFLASDQWPSEVVAQRNLDKRPCLTSNKLPTFVHQITNDLRQNRPSINVSPIGDQGDRDVAKMYKGLIRATERDSVADIAYDTGATSAVSNGFGYWRILTDWENPDSFNLVALIKRIRNPFTVYLDPNHIEPDGSDCKWAMVSDMMDRDDFEAQWPDADPCSFTSGGIGESMKTWSNETQVRIAEYFEIEQKKRTLIALSNGHEGWEDELDEVTLKRIETGALTIEDERESYVPKVMWYKVSQKEVLERKEWPGQWIPIVKVIGDEIDIEGRVKYSGVIRNAKDPQRMYNYWITSATEAVALAPKAPWVVEEGQIEGHEDEWRMANVRNVPYLSYKATSAGGSLAPPPSRTAFAQIPTGIEAMIQQTAQDLMATTGVRFDATMNERLMDESGKAIRELRRTGDLGSFHYVDNFARSLRHTGVILMDLYPKIYDAKRVATILREDGTEEQVMIDPNLPKPTGEMRKADGKIMKMFNPTYGRYGVTVTIGPSYATKRIEAAENMMAFARALPNTAPLIADLIAKAMDFDKADEIAARIAKSLPPGLLTPDMKDVPPQVAALLQQLDAQVKQLTQHLQAALAALKDKNADRALDAEKIQRDFDAKLLKLLADIETKTDATQQKGLDSIITHIRGLIEANEKRLTDTDPGADEGKTNQ